MRVEFRLTDDQGKNYQGVAELRKVDAVRSPGESTTHATAVPKAKGLPEHILTLREDGFFCEPRTPSEVHAKLLESYHCLLNRVQMALLRLHRKRELRKTTKKIVDHEHIAYVW